MVKYGVIAIALALIIGLFAGASVYAQPTVADLEGDLMCPCGGCTDVLAECVCETAIELRTTIGEMIEEGQTKQQILDYFVDQYGEEVLVTFVNENPPPVVFTTLEEGLMCPCGGCTDVLVDCVCDTAVEMRTTIGAMVEEGQTDQQIVAYFVGRYGEEVLVASGGEVVAASTTGDGVSLVVWVVPFVAIAGGGVALYFILQGRSQRGRAARRKKR